MFVVEGSFVQTKSHPEMLYRKQIKAEWTRLKRSRGGRAGGRWGGPSPIPPSHPAANRAPLGDFWGQSFPRVRLTWRM